MINTTIRDIQELSKTLGDEENAFVASEQISKLGVAVVDESEEQFYLIARLRPDQLKRRGEKLILNLKGLSEGAVQLAEENELYQ